MAANVGHSSRSTRRGAVIACCLLVLWLGCSTWNVVKPLPAGTHVTSLPARLAESQVDFLDEVHARSNILQRGLAALRGFDH
jgi:hypothetical protein